MWPRGGALIGGSGHPLSRCAMVCHCLLIETREGLVLVDSGFGTDDIRQAGRRLGPMFQAMFAPTLTVESTALYQLRQLGYHRSDVRHVVLTHLDLDHVGGISDFPQAQIHVLQEELSAAMGRRGRRERVRYHPAQWAHGPRWVAHDVTQGERVLGFEAVRAVVEPEVLMLAAAGHTRGHAVVAVKQGDGWLLHCGDAYFHRAEMRGTGRCPVGFRVAQRFLTLDRGVWLQNRERLRELEGDEGVRMFCAHDAEELRGMSPRPQ